MKTLTEMLDELDEFFVRSPDANKLWDILSALRGPDYHISDFEGAHKVKMQTTVYIRQAAFPKAAQSSNLYHPSMETYSEIPFTPNPKTKSNHFNHHIAAAANALASIGRE